VHQAEPQGCVRPLRVARPLPSRRSARARARARLREDHPLTVRPSPLLATAEFTKIASATSVGFLLMGFIGFFVKLIHIPINNIIVGGG
jgi:preprotein translocase subunit Sss1